MSKDKISDYSATANSNTDIGGINIDEGCAPSGINDAIRTLMKQLKDFQQGTQSDVFKGPLQVGAASVIEVTDNTNAALRITQLGTGNALLVEDSSNPDSSPFVVNASGNVGIGTTSPATILEAKTATGGVLTLSTSDTIVSTGDVLGGINFQAPNEASGSQSILVGASISAVASVANFNTTNNNTDIVFYTNATAASPTERMRIDSSGNLLLNNSSGYIGLGNALTDYPAVTYPAIYGTASGGTGIFSEAGHLVLQPRSSGALRSIIFATGNAATEKMRIDSSGNVLVTGAGGLGYGTGSGGTVTQATSRTTGVTLNKTNGAITLVSAAGSTTIQSFTVTNSTVAATDTIHVVQKSGTDLYRIYVTAVAAGSFKISYATLSGTTTEQPVFNFSVIKAVTS